LLIFFLCTELLRFRLKSLHISPSMPPLPNNQPMDERPPSPLTPTQSSVPQSTGSLVVPTPTVALSVDGSSSDVENLSPSPVGPAVTTASKPPQTSTPVQSVPFSRNTPKRQTYHGKDAAKPHQPVPAIVTVSMGES